MSSPSDLADEELPAVDERLVAPDSGFEIDDGRLVPVAPALEPHGDRHSKVVALLEAHVRDDFNVAADMLTRTSRVDDFAPDASVYPRARDPRTGGRQLEHLAFEIASTQSLADLGRKAAKLVKRGVRRVFAIDVERVRAFEWSRDLGTWSLLDLHTAIEDAALAVPLPLDALAQAAKTDDTVARALLAKQNPVLVAALTESRFEGAAEGRAEGRAEGIARAVLRVLTARGLAPMDADRDRILAMRDAAVLERWLDRAVACATIAELFGAG